MIGQNMQRLGNPVKQIINIHWFLLCSGFSAPYLSEKQRTCRVAPEFFFIGHYMPANS